MGYIRFLGNQMRQKTEHEMDIGALDFRPEGRTVVLCVITSRRHCRI